MELLCSLKVKGKGFRKFRKLKKETLKLLLRKSEDPIFKRVLVKELQMITSMKLNMKTTSSSDLKEFLLTKFLPF